MSQTIPSKFISLVPTNGNQFTGGQGNKIIFELEPSLGFVKGRDSYLVLKVLNSDTTERQRTMLNNLAGVDSLISRVDIYSLKTGQHLETLQNYNQWSCIENQYFYDDKTNIRAMSGVGSEAYAYSVTDSNGTQTPTAPLANSPNDCVLSPIQNAGVSGAAVYNYRVFTTPLKCGIFRWWDDEKLTPVLNMLGLRIEITLEDPKRALLNVEAVSAAGVAHSLVGDGTADSGFPCQAINNSDTIESTLVFTAGNEENDCGFAIGNVVHLKNSADALITNAAGTSFTIIDINATGANEASIQFDVASTGGDSGAGVHMYLTNDTRAYKVEPEFRVLTVAPQDVSGVMDGVDYEFTSYDLYFDTLFTSQLKHQVDIPCVQTRALAIMSQFEDMTFSEGRQYSSYFSGSQPTPMNCNSVQYFIKGRLAPVRAYDPRATKEKIIAEHELVKALTTINKEPQDLGQADKFNLNNYTNTWVVARELARGNYFYDLSDAEPQIRLGFSGTRTNNLTINTAVWSKKIVVADPQQGIRVIL